MDKSGIKDISYKEIQATASGNGTSINKLTPNIFDGSVAQITLKLSFPILISQLLSFTYTIVDTFFISMIDRQSTALLSGVGLVFPIYLCFFNIGRSLFGGMSSLAARGIGNKNEEVINKAGDSGLLLSLAIGIVAFALSLLFGREIIHFFAGSKLTAETIGYGIDYFYFLLPGMVLLLLVLTFAGILQGEGLAKYVGWATTISTIINIILNPILIFTFNLGVKGSALATSIAIGCTFLYYVYLFHRKKTTTLVRWNVFNASNKLIKEILRISVPAAAGMLLINISTILLNNLVSSISEEAMNAWVLVSRTDQLFLIPAFAIGLSSITMIGQNYGRGNLKRATKIFQVNIVLCITICACLTFLYVIFSPEIFRIFTSVPEVIAGSVKQVKLLAFTTIGTAVMIVIACSFTATGRPLPNLINNFILAAITCTPLLLSLVNIAIQDMTPIFISVGVANILSCIIAFIWGRSHFRKLQYASNLRHPV